MSLERKAGSDDFREWITQIRIRGKGASAIFSARFPLPELPEELDYECESDYSDLVEQNIPGVRTDFNAERGYDEEIGIWNDFMNTRYRR